MKSDFWEGRERGEGGSKGGSKGGRERGKGGRDEGEKTNLQLLMLITILLH